MNRYRDDSLLTCKCCYKRIHTFLIANTQRFYKKAAAFVLRAVAKHSPQLAQVSSQTRLRISFQRLLRKAHIVITFIDKGGKMQSNGWIVPSTVVIIFTIIKFKIRQFDTENRSS